VEVEDGDSILTRLDLTRKLVIRDLDGVPHLRIASDGRCLALAGALGRHTRCTIYSDRPSACRRVHPGDALCIRYRREHGLDSRN
jgi:Fe-S-cluster containining protein